MKKRVMSVLSVLLVLGMLAACGGEKSPVSAAPESSVPESSAPAPATDWPTKPITVIVPGGAGGDTDLNTRIFCKYLQDEVGQTVVVTNIKGMAVAIEEFKNAAPDGYTAYVHHPGLFVASQLGTVNDSWKDFRTVGAYAVDRQSAWFVSKDAPYMTLDELAEASKSAPIGFATEVGSMSHLTELMFMDLVEGSQFNIVDAGGAADKITALMSGQLDLMFNQVGLVKDYLKNGDFVCLGIMAEERSEANPDIPTFKEQGYDIVLDKPFFWLFPAGTDDAVMAAAEEAFQNVFANEAYASELLETMQTVPGNMTTEESVAYMSDIDAQYAELIAAIK
ncbi:MAG: tripartite tricarboxylate transporter substrate binding protein [Candidatus Heteroscillospira sp.]|jgi:tripartite-type tricarboxylate transporter receptor subunit TctC